MTLSRDKALADIELLNARAEGEDARLRADLDLEKTKHAAACQQLAQAKAEVEWHRGHLGASARKDKVSRG